MEDDGHKLWTRWFVQNDLGYDLGGQLRMTSVVMVVTLVVS